ncbi:uncharacterized protein EDB93DRAFT_1101920 [Suillus bovinus]|uniref:uncharacterized protein n=1 Tax=Suillus bovinus TaxID=48563 RepID=UPI001B8675D7|nr:uncharacterized protein EDB93DRAFT_1101920 [Suillus bovinus]KAG2155362.1 hypothetical protein EDB93DRAFT_1101920 [Suillus bovinus]
MLLMSVMTGIVLLLPVKIDLSGEQFVGLPNTRKVSGGSYCTSRGFYAGSAASGFSTSTAIKGFRLRQYKGRGIAATRKVTKIGKRVQPIKIAKIDETAMRRKIVSMLQSVKEEKYGQPV